MTTKTRHELVSTLLPYIENTGWTSAAIQECCTQEKIEITDFYEQFPQGVDDIITFIHEDITEQMLSALEKVDLEPLKVKDRVAMAVMTRFQLMATYRKAFYKGRRDIIKRISLASKTLFTIADAIWYSIGDETTDFNFYTKRLSLATVYASTFTYWMSDDSENFTNTTMFLERRLEDLSIIPKTKHKIKKLFERIPRFFMRN